jgi:hypothetical protein
MPGAPLTRASCDPALDRRTTLARRPNSPAYRPGFCQAQAQLRGAAPDFAVWGSVVPNLTWSNLARRDFWTGHSFVVALTHFSQSGSPHDRRDRSRPHGNTSPNSLVVVPDLMDLNAALRSACINRRLLSFWNTTEMPVATRWAKFVCGTHKSAHD